MLVCVLFCSLWFWRVSFYLLYICWVSFYLLSICWVSFKIGFMHLSTSLLRVVLLSVILLNIIPFGVIVFNVVAINTEMRYFLECILSKVIKRIQKNVIDCPGKSLYFHSYPQRVINVVFFKHQSQSSKDYKMIIKLSQDDCKMILS